MSIFEQRFVTTTRIALFDLDGCLFKSPSQDTIHDPSYWQRYWSDVDRQVPNPPVVDLFKTLLVSPDWTVIILTARPDSKREETNEALERAGISTWEMSDGEPIEDNMAVPLFMWKGEEVFGHGNWKRAVVEAWKENGADLAFMVEDYKPNADAIRGVIPVLLYERVK